MLNLKKNRTQTHTPSSYSSGWAPNFTSPECLPLEDLPEASGLSGGQRWSARGCSSGIASWTEWSQPVTWTCQRGQWWSWEARAICHLVLWTAERQRSGDSRNAKSCNGAQTFCRQIILPKIFKKHFHSPITCNKVEDTRLPSPSLISYTPSCLEVSLAMTISLVVPFLPSEMRPRYRMSWSVIWPSRISCTEPRGGLGSKGPREDSSGYRVGVNMRWACRMGRKRGRFRDSLVKRVTLKERPG